MGENLKIMDVFNHTYENQELVPLAGSDCRTWHCTSHNVVGGGYKNGCDNLIGAACLAAPSVWSMVCFAGTCVACYNPVGIVCTGGQWLPVCEY